MAWREREYWITMTPMATQLAQFLAGQMHGRQWGVRDAAAFTHVSKSTIWNILRDQAVPTLDVLEKLAGAFDVPLWKMIEMAGVHLQLPATPSAQAQRLTALLEHEPAYQPLIDRLLALQVDDLAGVLAYIEALEAGGRSRRNVP